MDFAVLTNQGVKKESKEPNSWYLDLARELKKIVENKINGDINRNKDPRNMENRLGEMESIQSRQQQC